MANKVYVCVYAGRGQDLKYHYTRVKCKGGRVIGLCTLKYCKCSELPILGGQCGPHVGLLQAKQAT